MKKNNNLIVKIILILCGLLFIGMMIYFYIEYSQTKDKTYKENIYSYLNNKYNNEYDKTKSPILGLLNYNFNEISTTLSIDSLIYTNLMSNSIMNDIGVNNIYKSLYGVTKDEYTKRSNYLLTPELNCYYQKDKLNQNINCDNICSKDTKDILLNMNSIFKWDNLLPEDATKFCIKNVIYPVEEGGYFVNLSDMKTLYKNITNKELTLNSTITSNKYYQYNSYLCKNSNRLDDYMKEITSIDSVKKDGEYLVVSYQAISNKNKDLSGIVTLSEDNDKYYIVSNRINTTLTLN